MFTVRTTVITFLALLRNLCHFVRCLPSQELSLCSLVPTEPLKTKPCSQRICTGGLVAAPFAKGRVQSKGFALRTQVLLQCAIDDFGLPRAKIWRSAGSCVKTADNLGSNCGPFYKKGTSKVRVSRSALKPLRTKRSKVPAGAVYFSTQTPLLCLLRIFMGV